MSMHVDMLSYASCRSDGSGELSLDEPGTREMLHSIGQLHPVTVGIWIELGDIGRTDGKRLCMSLRTAECVGVRFFGKCIWLKNILERLDAKNANIVSS